MWSKPIWFFVTPENTDMGIEVSKRLSGLDFSGFTREKIAENIMADAESGWDFSPRCEMHQIECAYVDLNSILYRNEMNMAYFAEVLGKKEEKEWKQAALLRRQRMEQYLFDGNVYLDYNVVRQEHSPIFSVASFYPLWAGVATTEQAKRPSKICIVWNIHMELVLARRRSQDPVSVGLSKRLGTTSIHNGSCA